MKLYDHLPTVSVLVAARNEEENILECLQGLASLDYPTHKLEILIGNDQSEDKTEEIVLSFSAFHVNIHLYNIESSFKQLKGKANVLAQLIEKSKGEFLLITDADSKVAPSWIKGILENFDEKTSIVTGATVMEGTSFFGKLQNAEWIFYLGNGHIYSEKGRPVSAVGNNMALTRTAYYSVGGYENIPFSITEDYELFKHIVKAGGTFKTAFEPKVLVYTKPIKELSTFFQQRKRWLSGGFQLPTPFVIGLTFLWLLLPIFIVVGLLLGWKIAALLFLTKWIADIFFLKKLYKMVQMNSDIGLWLYTPYSLIFNTIILIFYLIPAPVIWKGRKYKIN